jgi:hypothetical protein
MPQGKVRPPIEPPRLGAHEVCNPATSVRIVKLTSYRFLDDSEWTMREFDYRLRWTLYADHRHEGSGHSNGHAHATVEVWSRRDAEWHEVWELSRAAESPFGAKWEPKARSWNALLDELAQYATEALL